jgi:peptidoglycan/LPS O-acetylase OafA/YrhL
MAGTAAAPKSQDRNLGLDLIRALGVVLVMAAHYQNNYAAWFGVKGGYPCILFAGTLAFEFFFVMSGFLIGRLLMEIARIAPTWRNLGIFLVRRWLRTLPLYYAWLVVLLAVFPPQKDWWGHALMFLTMTQNLLHPMPEDYFFAVSWSLAVEEWFYLTFGAAMIIGTMLFGRRAGMWGTLALFLIGPMLLRLTVPGFSDWDTGYGKMVVFRIDEIAYGVLMAELYVRRSWVFRHPLLPFCAGALIIVYYRALIPPSAYFPFDFTAMALGSALCLPMILRIERAPRSLEFLGRRLSAQSYGLYIFHLTILVDLTQQTLLWPGHIGRWGAVALSIALPIVLSYVSFHYFESPILAKRPKQRLGAYTQPALSAHLPAPANGGDIPALRVVPTR